MTEASIRGQKGMASVKDMPVLQDGPPPGGFPAVRYARRIANSGPSGLTVLLVSSAVIGWGMYQVGQGNIHRRLDLIASLMHSTFYVFLSFIINFPPADMELRPSRQCPREEIVPSTCIFVG